MIASHVVHQSHMAHRLITTCCNAVFHFCQVGLLQEYSPCQIASWSIAGEDMGVEGRTEDLPFAVPVGEDTTAAPEEEQVQAKILQLHCCAATNTTLD